MIEGHTASYTGRNLAAREKLHHGAFYRLAPCGITACMERKPTYIRAWRKAKGFTQKDVVGRLAAIDVQMTEASLSRIENGKQPYTQDTLEAIAAALGVERWQLLRDEPTKQGEVVDFIAKLSEVEAARAESVLRAMFEDRAKA